MPDGRSSSVLAAALVPGLVRCGLDEDWAGWERLWSASPTPVLTAAALSSLCAHLLARVAQLTEGDRDDILREFALRLAAYDLEPPAA